MKRERQSLAGRKGQFMAWTGLGMRAKLIILFILETVLPIMLLTIIIWGQITNLGNVMRDMAVEDSSAALNASAVENIERMSTDTASRVADFLYARDDDLRYLAGLAPSEEAYRAFAEQQTGRVVERGTWELAEDGKSWVRVDEPPVDEGGGVSTNSQNNDGDGFHYRPPNTMTYEDIPLYDEIAFIGLDGQELVKYVTPNSTKENHPMNTALVDVSRRENTFVRAETYFEEVQKLQPGEIYVSDVIGAYVGSNYIGMYTPDIVATAAQERGYDIAYDAEAQAFAGQENPNGERFEGIVRWATPVAGADGAVMGYVTFALNHDHIMEFTDHLTPMNERYTAQPSASEGNYAFIWDYQCRSICHPRHHSITGFDPETGEPQVPWLETSIYEAWQESGVPRWDDFLQQENWPTFDNQSREKNPAAALTQAGLVALDGRYLNNAPQCIGWMDLTGEGGSGSFYILWSGIYKLNTAAAIPYYTGQYAPSQANEYSKRGFGFVAIGAGLEDFTRPATETEKRLDAAIRDNLSDTSVKLIVTTGIIILAVVLIAVILASSITGNITRLIKGISRFRAGERQFRFNDPVKDEFGTLADSFDDMAESIVSSVKNPLCITDMERGVIYMNEPGLAVCHTTLEEIVGTPYQDSSIYPGGTNYDPIDALEQGREAEIYFNEASERYLKGVANFFADKDGRKVGYIVETTDMTDMVWEQMKIEEQKRLLDMIFAASPDMIWYMDEKGVYVTVNPRFAAIVGCDPEDFVGKQGRDILPAEIAQHFVEQDMAAIASGRPGYADETVTFADGHRETLDAVRTPIFDEAGLLIGLLGFARDVTVRVGMENELRNTQQELEKAVNDANRANEHKSEFLARMSHEIRTPMNAIIGVTNIVQRRMADFSQEQAAVQEVEGHLNQIEASSQHLLGLLNDILDVSKIEAGKIELEQEAVELDRLANTVYGIIKPRCEDKHIEFIADFDSFEPSTFCTDALRLRQVLINLLGNAVKFTPECGTIRFGIHKLDKQGDRVLVDFEVQDTGIGIAEDSREAIFQPFEQGGAGVARQHGGTGLGLSISNSIVGLFGGQLAVDSELGKGSNFHFRIWLQETAAVVPAESKLEDMTGQLAGKRMLLVDDVAINRVIVASMLEDTGLEIDEANDGESAVAMFKGAPPNTYDIILMDVQMPNMNGYEASTAIRALDRPDAATVPIVALTANAFKEDIDTAMSYGMNSHVAKPVEMDVLLEVLYRFVKAKDE